jgi:hypothetical protein
MGQARISELDSNEDDDQVDGRCTPDEVNKMKMKTNDNDEHGQARMRPK